MVEWIVVRFCSCIAATWVEDPLPPAAPEAMSFGFGISDHSVEGPFMWPAMVPDCALDIGLEENPSDEDSDGLTSHKELKSIGSGVRPLPEVRSSNIRDRSSKEPNGN